MVNLKTLRTTNRSLIDPETGTEYRRMAGGFVWPDKGIPGFLILIGETWQTLNDRSHYGLFETSLQTIKDAFTKIAELPGQYFFQDPRAPCLQAQTNALLCVIPLLCCHFHRYIDPRSTCCAER